MNIKEESFKTYSGNIGKKEYLKFLDEYHQFLIELILNGHLVVLPRRMGTLSVVGKKQKVSFEDGRIKGLAPDWKKTKDLWAENEVAKREGKVVYHENHDTNGYRYRLFWSKKNIYVENKYFYSFKLSRANKRALSAKIQETKGEIFKDK